jgi:hypothetical protein
MLTKLTVSSSGLDFSDSNYNYDNTNTNVSFHQCNNLPGIGPACTAKKNNHTERALVALLANEIF